MVEKELVKKYKYGARSFDFYCIIDSKKIPILAPSLFLFDLAKQGQSFNTNKAYASDLKSFFTILSTSKGSDGAVGLSFIDVTDEQMSGYINGYLLRQNGLAVSSIERHIATLNAFYNFSYEHGFVERKLNYSFALDEEVRETDLAQLNSKLHQVYISESQFKSIILANIEAKNPFIKERNELALKLGYYAGFRTEELVIPSNLDVKKLNEILSKANEPEAVYLDIKGKSGKVRTVLINVELVNALKNFLWGRAKHIKTNLMCTLTGKALIDSSFGTNTFLSCIKKYLINSTMSDEEVQLWLDRSYHILRKCFATERVSFCYENGLDPRVFVPQWMGHEEFKTSEIYIFFDALLNNRVRVLKDLSLDDSLLAKKYKSKFKKDKNDK